MADDLKSLADLLVINDQNAADVGATDLLQKAPLLSALHAVAASNGTQHKYLKENAAPVVGFRAANAGIDHDDSGDVLVSIDCEILDASFHVDNRIAKAYRDGVDAFMQREAIRHLRAAFKKFDAQLLNGTAEGDAAGFDGFADALDTLGDTVLTGGGTANRTSIYLIRTTSDEANVCSVIANNGEIEIGDYFEQFVEDGTGKKFLAYMQNIEGHVAAQVGGKYSIVRLANVDYTGATGTSLDDDLIYEAIERFADGDDPTHIVMHSKCRELLRKSRTATNGTGAPAPRPTDVEGIPIVVDNNLTLDETAVTA